jgi:hypothetical protein
MLGVMKRTTERFGVGGPSGRLTPSLWAAEHAAPDVACELGVDLRTL